MQALPSCSLQFQFTSAAVSNGGPTGLIRPTQRETEREDRTDNGREYEDEELIKHHSRGPLQKASAERIDKGQRLRVFSIFTCVPNPDMSAQMSLKCACGEMR